MLLLTLLTVASAEDVRDLVNAWRVSYNAAVDLYDAGKYPEALVLVEEAVQRAPPSQVRNPLILQASLAGELREYELALNSLDRLLPDAGVPWNVFFNGAITARIGGYPASAHRYSRAAWARGKGHEAEIAPLFVSTAIDVELWDEAVKVSVSVPPSEDYLLASLTRELVAHRRCAQARTVASRLPPDEEREELLGSCE